MLSRETGLAGSVASVTGVAEGIGAVVTREPTRAHTITVADRAHAADPARRAAPPAGGVA